MNLSKLEQETVVLYNNEEKSASVFTHDSKLIEKLKKLSEKYPDKIIPISATADGAVNYLVPKNCVLIREPYSEKRRQAASERAKTAGYRPPKRGMVSETE